MGTFVDGNALSFPCFSPQYAEVRAMAMALDWACLNGVANCIIETDCRRIVEALCSSSLLPNWPGNREIEDIKNKAQAHLGVSFRFIGRLVLRIGSRNLLLFLWRGRTNSPRSCCYTGC